MQKNNFVNDISSFLQNDAEKDNVNSHKIISQLTVASRLENKDSTVVINPAFSVVHLIPVDISSFINTSKCCW